MSRARDFADLAGSADAGGLTGRNLIINGAMTVAQRSTSQQITDSSGGYFTCDRWRYSQFNSYSADIDATMSQETDTPNNTFKNSFKFLVGTGTAAAAGDAIAIEQIIEGQDIVQLAQGTSDAKKFTVSFWVKASIAGTYCISLHSGKSFSSNRSHIKEYTILSANTWEYKTVTVDGDTSGTWAEDNGAGLSLAFTLGAGSTYQGAANTWSDSDYLATSNQTQLTETTNATWFVTAIQLEVGETATPFEHRSFGDDLAACQRYFQKSYDYGTAIGTATTVSAMFHRHTAGEAVSNRTPNITFPVEMRDETTTVVYSLNGTAAAASDCGTGFTHSSDITSTNFSGTDGTHGLSRLGLGTGADAIIGFHYTADAEL